jgi:hypothetical protein
MGRTFLAHDFDLGEAEGTWVDGSMFHTRHSIGLVEVVCSSALAQQRSWEAVVEDQGDMNLVVLESSLV